MRRLEELFHDVNRDDGDPLKWTIEGVGYASWTEAAETWSKIENTGVSGRAIYNQLAVLAHPQGYSATVGLRPDPADASGTIRLVDLIRVEKAARITVQSFYSALTMLTSYHGLRSKIVSRWESEIQAVFPTFFNADGDAADLEENT